MELSVFEFNGLQVRFVGTPEVPEWVALDVIDILYPDSDRRNRSNYLAKVEDEWKRHKKLMTSTGPKETTTILEPGLYQLILGSSSSLAKPFQKWVFEEVLPSIRKTGKYEVKPARKVSVTPRRIVCTLEDIFGKLVDPQRLAIAKADAIAQVFPELAPAVNAAIPLLPSAPAEEKTLTPTEVGQECGGISAQKVNTTLEAMGLQRSTRAGRGKKKWHATPEGEQHARTTLIKKGNGTPGDYLEWLPSVVPLVQNYLSTQH